MNTDLMFSSKTDLWATPQYFFNKLKTIFDFTIDVCANSENAKFSLYYTIDENGLNKEWKGICWMNPPYGRDIYKWVEKAYKSSEENGATVVCLLPSRTDTKWFHDYCMKGELYFIKGRLKFGDSKNSAPFPSVLVVFRSKVYDSIKLQNIAANNPIANMTDKNL